jgi:ribonuclease P protein component
MDTKKEGFKKSERLCSTKVIRKLAESGNIFYTPLFKIIWAKSDNPIPSPAQVAFSVSKKTFRLAVTRNLIKRRMREAYRKNKISLYNELSSEKMQIVLLIIFRRNYVPGYAEIENSTRELIKKLPDSIRSIR